MLSNGTVRIGLDDLFGKLSTVGIEHASSPEESSSSSKFVFGVVIDCGRAGNGVVTFWFCSCVHIGLRRRCLWFVIIALADVFNKFVFVESE